MRLGNSVSIDEKDVTVCEKNSCVGCMVCVEICPTKAISIKDTLSEYNAVINRELCINCNLCKEYCQVNNEIELKEPINWCQGWAEDDGIRAAASSGGVATALAYSFVNDGGIVCSCIFSKGEFKFGFAKNVNELNHFTGSKYVKSNPRGIYKKIKEYLMFEQKILFIGLPCQVSALRLYLGENLEKNLFTVDLICHGTPSPQLFQDFIKQCGVKIDLIEDIAFRTKNVFGIKIDGKTIFRRGVVDPYLLTFLCAVNYTENCYQCKYATIKRGSDLTIGDSWGSDMSVEEQKQGISLILCQTAKGERLLSNAELILKKVNIENAILANEQLRKPTKKTFKRRCFFKVYKDGDFKRAAFLSLANKSIRQKIKNIMIKYKILQIK